MNRISSLWNSKSQGTKSAIVFTLAILISRGISFITTPIFTRIMPTDQIGIVGLYTSSFAILSSITSLALNSGGFMVGMKEFEGRRDQYVSSILTLTSITGFLALILFLLFPSFWTNLLGLPLGLVVLMSFGCILTPAYEFWLMRQRYEYAYKKAALITILTSIGSTILAVIAVLLLKDYPTLLGEVRQYVAVGSSLLVYVFFWILQLKKGRVYFNNFFWTSSLALSIPLLGHSFASQMLSVSDRLFIGKLVDNSAVGIYSTLYTVGSLALMLWGAINSSFVPYLFQNIEDETKRGKVSYTALLLLIMFSALTICVSIIAPEITYMLAPAEYLEYVSIVPPIVAGVYFIAVGNFYSNLLVYCKKTWAIMLSTMIACSISVSLNVLLIPVLGFEVAAYNTLFSYLVFGFLQAIFSYRIFKKKLSGDFIYNNAKMILVSVSTIVLSMICIPLYKYNLIRYAFALILIIIALFLFYEKDNKKNSEKDK